jgi:hypothetical protein
MHGFISTALMEQQMGVQSGENPMLRPICSLRAPASSPISRT